ncbi:hypothetical protein K456DRAFT_32435 [Colletotrichum gloeosporioides 23]|nr:hypothetical protein K456DRAFT_32435 [Colletotrichum gloeosporioides 23]
MPAWCSPLSLWSPMSSQPGCLEQGHPSGKAGCWSLSSLQGVDTARKKGVGACLVLDDGMGWDGKKDGCGCGWAAAWRCLCLAGDDVHHPEEPEREREESTARGMDKVCLDAWVGCVGKAVAVLGRYWAPCPPPTTHPPSVVSFLLSYLVSPLLC